MAHAHHEHGHGHHGDHDGDFHPRKISFPTVHAMLLKNTPPARHGAVQLGEDHTTPRMSQALAFYRKDMQDIVALSASPHLPWGTPWAGTAVGAILGLTYGIGTPLVSLVPPSPLLPQSSRWPRAPSSAACAHPR